MNFKPLHDRMLLKPLAAETKDQGRHHPFPTSARKRPMQGEVVAVGQGQAAGGRRLGRPLGVRSATR